MGFAKKNKKKECNSGQNCEGSTRVELSQASQASVSGALFWVHWTPSLRAKPLAISPMCPVSWIFAFYLHLCQAPSSTCRLCQVCVRSKMLNHYLPFRVLPSFHRVGSQSWLWSLYSIWSGTMMQTCFTTQYIYGSVTHKHTRHAHTRNVFLRLLIPLQVWLILAKWQKENPPLDRC